MNSIEFRWVEMTGRYQRGEKLFVGKWNVGSIGPDVLKSSNGSICVYTRLPGLKERLSNRENITDAKQALERAVTMWFTQSGVTTDEK